ncbi:hypothetical protein ACSSS7_002187 [Eimeria intestinalis]
MPKPPPSPQASIPIINSYCNERHDGKLVCVLDPLKGRTLRATKAFAVGGLILKEPPLHAVRLDPENPVCSNLMDLCEKQSFKHPAIWYWCALNSVLVEDDPPVPGLQAVTRRQWELLRTLFIPEVVEPSSEATTLVDYMGLRGIVDGVDLEIMIQVWLHNCFEHHRDPEGYIIYFMPSFCSHSCIPNALWCTDEDSNFLFSPRATISAGDEITLTYLPEEDMLASTARRRSLLEGAKDFKCMCESGALLMPPEDHHPSSEHPTSAHDPKPTSVASSGQRADTGGQPAAPASVLDGEALASNAHSEMLVNQQKQNGITLYTIWARLVSDHHSSLRKEAERWVTTSSKPGPASGSSEHAPQSLAPPESTGDASGSFLSSFRETSALVSPELVARILQKPQSGRCYMCKLSWTEAERKRALAVEKVVEATYSRFEEMESEYSVSFLKNGVNELLSDWTRSQEPFFEEREMADERARKALAGVDAQTALRILKKGWHLLDRHERTIVDSVIQLTFSSHWLAAQWFRFLEMNSSPSRKMPHLDRLIWQYRNLYPGLTPAVAWAVWSVAQALLSLEENPKLENVGSFQRYADQCIVSSYKESVFILSTLFGAKSSFTASIVDDYGDAVAKCIDRLVQQTAPKWRDVLLAKLGNSEPPRRLEDPQLPSVWPCYISFCADLLVSAPVGSARLLGK